MGTIVGMRGFGCRNVTRDRLTVLAGAHSYITTGLASGSLSNSALQQVNAGSDIRAPFYNDNTGTPYTTTNGEAWFHIRYRTALVAATNMTSLFMGLGFNGSKMIGLSCENTTGKLTLIVTTNVRATASVFAYSVGVWERLHVHVGGLTTGSVINVYANGNLSTPILSHTLIGADETNLLAISSVFNEFRLAGKGGSPASEAYDCMVCYDPNGSGGSVASIQQLAELSIAEQVFTGNGAEQQWTGAYTDIDERPNSDTDKLTATTTGDESSFTKDAIGADNVFAVQVMARIRRTDASTGVNLTIKTNDGTNTDTQVVSAPGDGDAMHIFQQAPDGNPWTPDLYDPVRVAFIATA